RLFLAFASYIGFTVYQMDVKSAFLYGTIEEELLEIGMRHFLLSCWRMVSEEVKQQPDGIFISQDKYVADTIKKFDFWSIRIATTPTESNKPLVKDKDGEDVDVHVYMYMIGSLMYLTASRPDIMFAVCACARFQVTPKASHLNAVKRIFRYLKHQTKLGLWYPKDSPFDLEAFLDINYGGASLDRKSTTGGYQFLGKRLISWQCKKQTIVANSTTEVEYVAAAHCYCYEKRRIEVVKIHINHNVADLLTKGFDVTRFNFLIVSIGMKSLDLKMNGICASYFSHIWVVVSQLILVIYKLILHNMVGFLKKPGESVGFAEAVDFLKGTSLNYALTHNPTVYDSLVKQFWQTATVRILANGNQQLEASIDNKPYTITEASFISKLQLADAAGISNLPDADIYAGLETLGCSTRSRSPPRQEPKIPQSQDPTPTFEADDAITTGVEVETKGATITTSGLDTGLDSGNIYESPLKSHETPPQEGHTSRSVKDSVKLQELMVLVPKLESKIDNLEKELKETKQTLGSAIRTLAKKVKSLEVELKRKTKKVVVSDTKDEEIEARERKIQELYDDPLVSLVKGFVTPIKTTVSAIGEEQVKDISPI
ncbi:hypothetical protein Tco_1522559, partial [Tanacetum coccineum]